MYKKIKKCVFCKKNKKYNCCLRAEIVNINNHENKKRMKFYKNPEKLRKIKKNLAVICNTCMFCSKMKKLDCCISRQWLLSARAEEAAILHRTKTRGMSIIRIPKPEEEE